MGSATPSLSGVGKHKGTAAGRRPGPAPDSRGGGVRASEGTNPCTCPSFATKNVFDVLQDLSESIGGSDGQMQMGSLSPLSTTCTSRLLSFWNSRRS